MAVQLDFTGNLEEILNELRQTKSSLEGVATGYEKVEQASKEAFNGAAAAQDKATKATKDNEKETKKQIGIIEKLEEHLKRLEKGQRKATDVTTVKKYNQEIAKTRATLSALRGAGVQGAAGMAAINAGGTASIGIFQALKGVIATTFAPLLAAGAIIGVFKGVIEQTNKFEQTAADLSAITGATGDSLEYLKQRAVELGVESTKSADEVLQAYKLIASAKPELLENADALALITEKAVTLAEASGLSLPDAATALTDAMNQFGASAEEADRFINVLAAGSQKGAAEIPQVTEALLKFGVAAETSKINVEESVGAIELLAEKGLKGAEAGTALRNVFSKLSATELLPKEGLDRLTAAGVDISKLSDTSLSLQERLTALAPIQNDANALTAVFGLENKNAAQILLQNIDRFDDLTTSITDTNTAYEQQITKTATATGEWQKLTATISSLVQGEGGGLSKFLAIGIRIIREVILGWYQYFQELRPTLSDIAEGFGSIFKTLSSLLPKSEKTVDTTNAIAKAFKILNTPLRLFLTGLKLLLNVLNFVIEGFVSFVKQREGLSNFFKDVGRFAQIFIDVFADLPLYLEGGFYAIVAFAKGVKERIGDLASNVGTVLKEAFSIGKLIKNGTGDLDAAVNQLKGTFDGLGTEISDAFNKPFEEADKKRKQLLEDAKKGGGFSFTPEGDGGCGAPPTDAAEKEKQRQKLIIQAMAEGMDKALALEKQRYDDLLEQLEKFGIDSEAATMQHELNKYAIRKQFLEQTADLEGLAGQERADFIYNQTLSEIQALEDALSTLGGGTLTDAQQQQLNLMRKMAVEEYDKMTQAVLASDKQLQDKRYKDGLQQINDEAERNRILIELGEHESSAAIKNESDKQIALLKIRQDAAKKQLELIEEIYGADSLQALQLRETINKIEQEIKGISAKGVAGDFNMWKLIGLDPNDPEQGAMIQGIETAVGAALDLYSQINAMRLESANQEIALHDQQIERLQNEIDNKQNALDRERELQAQGLAADVEGAQQEIANLKAKQAEEKKAREKAFEEKKKIQKQQAAIDTLTQASSLITAIAQIYQSLAALPFGIGVGIATALSAGMIAAFIAGKVKVFQSINQQKAAKGAFGILEGKRHSEGGIPFTSTLEAEGGEAYGILSRSATRKHGKAYEAITNALNKGDKEVIRGINELLSGTGVELDRSMPKELNVKATQIDRDKHLIAVLASDTGAETNRLLEQLVDNSKSKEDIKYMPNGDKVITKGNHVRVIKYKD